MRVSEYLEKGLKNLVDEKPSGYEEIGKSKSGCHAVNVYIKRKDGKIEDVKIKATKRCKKLLAIADYVAEDIRQKGRIEIDNQQILNFFKEEKETEKMIDRINLLKLALG